MKKLLIISITLLILLEWTTSSNAQSSGTKDSRQSFTGVYNVTFNPDQGQSYSARIVIQDLKNGKVEAGGDYNGYPISILGDVDGNPEEGGAVCSFTFNKAGMAMGKAEITIVKTDGEYKLNGYGSGSYSYMGKSGQITGKLTGSRKNTNAASGSNLVMAALIGLAAAGLIAATVYFIIINRKKS